MQKSRFYFVAYGLLAIAVVLAVLVACGKGIIEPPQDSEWEVRVQEEIIGRAKDCFKENSDGNNECNEFSSTSNKSSSGKGGSSSDSEGEESSSSEGAGGRSSSSEEEEEESSSSEEEESSSSTGPTHTLLCTGLAENGTKGTQVTRPTVKCGDNTISSSNATFTWRIGNCLSGDVKNESFSNPSAGEFLISVKADCGGENQEKCCGEIWISDGKSSSSAAKSSASVVNYLNCAFPSTGIVGVEIDISGAVNCGGNCKCASNNLTWDGVTTSWFKSPTVGTKNFTVKGTGGTGSECSDNCSITIRSSSSGGGGTSSSSGPCNKTGYCKYGDNECHKMPTDDCCNDGRLFTSENECKNASIQYCNWGKCEGGSAWSCTSGGCYALNDGDLKASDCTSKSGSIVSSCPAGTCPPSANYCK